MGNQGEAMSPSVIRQVIRRVAAELRRSTRDLFPGSEIAEPLAGRVRARQVAAVTRLTPITVAANLATSTLLVLSFSSSPYRLVLMAWFVANCLLSFVTLRRWLKGAPRTQRPSCPPDVIRRAVRNALALGSLWSVVALLLFPGADASKQVLLTCLISGMLSGGAFALSPIRRRHLPMLP